MERISWVWSPSSASLLLLPLFASYFSISAGPLSSLENAVFRRLSAQDAVWHYSSLNFGAPFTFSVLGTQHSTVLRCGATRPPSPLVFLASTCGAALLATVALRYFMLSVYSGHVARCQWPYWLFVSVSGACSAALRYSSLGTRGAIPFNLAWLGHAARRYSLHRLIGTHCAATLATLALLCFSPSLYSGQAARRHSLHRSSAAFRFLSTGGTRRGATRHTGFSLHSDLSLLGTSGAALPTTLAPRCVLLSKYWRHAARLYSPHRLCDACRPSSTRDTQPGATLHVGSSLHFDHPPSSRVKRRGATHYTGPPLRSAL